MFLKEFRLLHKNEAAAALNINAYIGNTSDDIELLALPVKSVHLDLAESGVVCPMVRHYICWVHL